MKYNNYLLLLILFLSNCAAPRFALRRGYDISKVKSISIGQFLPYKEYPTSADMVRNEFARQLLKHGYVVKFDTNNVDIILTGTVIQFSPSRRYLLYLGEETTAQDKTVVITQTAMEISGTNIYSIGSAFGLGGRGQILVSNATIGVTAKLVDSVTKELIWTDSFVYEALDIQTATEAVVNYLLRPLVKKK